ncbi:MAG: glycosyltransferase [Calditrichaeota bacterium]|nr:MAG: glycosyltransferase [Calditrichota bacterium]
MIAQRNLPGHLPFSKLRNILRNNKIRLVYEFDDAFWTLPSNHLAYNFYQQMMPELKNYIKSADLVTVSTDYMARYVAKLNKNVRVLENALDDALWTFREPRSAQDKIRLLFSGTPTHHDDLKIVVKPLLKILNEYGDRVEVILWGNEIEELMALPQVQRGPDFTPDYTLYARQLQSLDVDLAIVPLADTPFNRAKSHIKWLEYSACGITGIYSRVGAYPKHIKDKQTGLLVNNSHKAWYRALKWMLEHPEERLKMAIQAQEDIKKQHTISSATSRWYEAYATLVSLPEIPKIQSPVVSIIILAWNKWAFTEKCLKALQHNTTGIVYEVIVVDNGSDDQTWKNLQEWKASYPQLRPMRNETNLGFSVGNNRALKEARGPWVVFLNNDTEPRPHWLDAMLAIAQNDPSVGAVGAKLVYPDETIQHAGVAIVDDRKNGDPLLAQHILHGRPKDFPQANLMIEFQAVTAACMLMPRELAIKLNGFDEGYQNGYEDVDLCFRIREAGYKVVYQPHAELVHHESKSGPERFAHVAENIQRLHKRWMGKIRHDFRLEPNGEAIQLNGPITLYTPPGQTAETPKDDRPGVSIIMLTFNALEMTRQTITSVLEHTRYPYELIVVDNASGADTVAYLKELEQQHPHIKVLFNKENKGFSAGNNQGVAASDGHYVCLLNNDVLVGDGWLEDLVEAFDRDAQIGMVSAITNKASGLQVLASVPYKDETGFYKFAKEWRQEHRGQVTPRRRLAGFVMLTSRAIYDEIGGFDEIYGLGNFIDDDISLKIRQAGYALMVHDGTFIHHYGHSSFKANNIDLMASLKENEKIFNQKWPDVDYDELLEIKNPLHEVHPRKIEQATRALNDGDARQAFELYREVVDENPLSGEGLMGLAFAAFFLGELEEAEHALLRARLHFPEHAVVRNQLGMLYAHKGNWEQAVQYFQQAAERDAHYAEARHNLCQALIESGAYEKGLTVLTEWLNTHPEDVTGMMMMARYNLEVGRTDEARQYLERVLEIDPRNDEARQLLQQQTTASTEEQQATEMLEQAYELLNNFDEQNAEALFHKSGALHPAPEALFGEVLCALRKDQQLRAVTLLNKITDRWPDFAPACNQLGIIHFQDGRVEEALAWFARAIENDRDWLEPQRNYGLALIEKGDYENGIATFNKIIGQHPDDVESLLIIAGFYIEVERWNQAENMLQKILEIDPENETARRQLTEIKAHLEMPAP